MNKWFELLLGLILVIVAVDVSLVNYFGFGTAALEVLKGGIVWFVILVGFMLIVLGISDLKE